MCCFGKVIITVLWMSKPRRSWTWNMIFVFNEPFQISSYDSSPSKLQDWMYVSVALTLYSGWPSGLNTTTMIVQFEVAYLTDWGADLTIVIMTKVMSHTDHTWTWL